MHCKTEKSTRTVVALQVVQAFLYFIAFAIVLTAAGLFSRALSHFNSMIEGRDVCLLFKADQMTNPSPFICYGAIAIEALAGVGLMILVIVSILKIALKMMKNNYFLIFEIIFLIITATLAVLGASSLCAGWGITCDSLNEYLKDQGVDEDCNTDFLQDVTRAAACSGIACIFTAAGLIIFIINSVLSRQSKEITRRNIYK